MASLEELTVGASIEGIVPGTAVTVVSVKWHGSSSATLIYRDDAAGTVGQQLLFRSDEHRLRVLDEGRNWAFDGDGALYRLVSEAQRIRLAYLFDPLLAVHISNVVPLPHQIAAVYNEMLGAPAIAVSARG
ncbi:MAG: hypothetical protein WD472_07890 [Dehalococcoidia bacterium]